MVSAVKTVRNSVTKSDIKSEINQDKIKAMDGCNKVQKSPVFMKNQTNRVFIQQVLKMISEIQ